ncbi:MAG: formylglycine-generating enzyme family protein [Armatimonadota bacterium]
MSRLWALLAVVMVAVPFTRALAQETRPWQRQGTRTGEEITGPDGGKMVWVPAGEFTMGADDAGAHEKPAHRVRITRGFWLGKCEVTVAQWKRYCQAAGVSLKVNIVAPTEEHPMMGVSFGDITEYCRFYGLTVPTEAQWEYAARGAAGKQYPWGNAWDASKCCNNDNAGPTTATFPVGTFPQGASWCGALDMAGNLAEWCADWYAPDYYARSPQDDPTGPATGAERVERGGYCLGDAQECRSAYRFSDDPNNRDGAGGLRACWTP